MPVHTVVIHSFTWRGIAGIHKISACPPRNAHERAGMHAMQGFRLPHSEPERPGKPAAAKTVEPAAEQRSHCHDMHTVSSIWIWPMRALHSSAAITHRKASAHTYVYVVEISMLPSWAVNVLISDLTVDVMDETTPLLLSF